jgi:hypothetical protein
MFSNIEVKWVPGASPTCLLYDKDEQLIAKTELPDSTLQELRTLLSAAGLELVYPTYEKPTGPPQVTSSFGELHYELYLAKNDFKNAREFAESLKKEGFGQGRLPTIACEAQNDFLKELLRSNGAESVWLGATDLESEGEWKWLEGPLADRVFWTGYHDGALTQGLYANWRNGEPNNVHVENCAALLEVLNGWNDVSCEGIYLSILVEYGEPTVMCPETISTRMDETRVEL